MSDYLPPEVFMDIMMRLPVDSILRCTSVSKSWYSLITSPTFISLHLNRSIAKNSNNPKLLVRHCVKDHSIESDSYCTEEKYTVHSDNQTFDALSPTFTIPFRRSISFYRIIGISNGLLCLCDDCTCGTHSIFLWNPHIRKFFKLPTPFFTYQTHGGYNHAIGFGFIPSTNDFKIVRVVYLLDDDDIDEEEPQVEVYELSTGCWRKLNDHKLRYVIHPRSPQAFFNGAAHWVGYECSRYHQIVSFDMLNEVFGLIKMPPGVKPSLWTCRVAVYENSLAFLDYVGSSYESYDKYCNIWVMKEYGEADSWTKRFTIDLKKRNFTRSFGFQGNNNVFMATKERDLVSYYDPKEGDLVSYDPNTKKTKNLNIHGKLNSDANRDSFAVDTFVESLVLLGRKELSGDESIVSESREEDGF